MNKNAISQIITIVQEGLLALDDRAVIELRTEYFRMAQVDASLRVLHDVTKIIAEPQKADAHILARTLIKMVSLNQLLPSIDPNDMLRHTNDSPTLRRRMVEELESLKQRFEQRMDASVAAAAAEAEGATKQ